MYCHWLGGTGGPIETSVLFTPLFDVSISAGFVYWGWQTNFENTSNANVGAHHIGMQAVDQPANPRFINCGGYDDLAGGVGGVAEGSAQIDLPPHPNNINNAIFNWQVGVTYRYRIYRKPNQSGAPSGKVIWRAEMTDFSTGTTYQLRDMYYTSADHLGFVTMWTEIGTAERPPMKVRWSEARYGGLLLPSMDVAYATEPLTNVYTDRIGFVQEHGITRSVASRTVLNQPGVVPRSWAGAATGENFANPVSVPKPAGTVSGHRLLLACVVTGDRSGVTAEGFTLVAEGPVSISGADARIVVFAKRAGSSEPATYQVNQEASGPMAVGIVNVYGDDPAAGVVAGTINNLTSVTTNWSAPSLAKTTHFPRILHSGSAPFGCRWRHRSGHSGDHRADRHLGHHRRLVHSGSR